MSLPKQITIDGPAASGKSTVAEILAEKLGYLFFDTGVMYRAVTWAVIKSGVSVDDEETVSKLAEKIKIDVSAPTIKDGRKYDVIIDGEDSTWEIRRADVNANVSQVSAYARVRKEMTAQQRRIGQRGQVVMVGRDIGTVVIPEAELKIYLDASVEERAKRRFDEVISRGEETTLESILESMKRRDQIDSTREIAPLKAAEDARIINSDHMDVEGVVQQILNLINKS
jgi:cytidylate kinase